MGCRHIGEGEKMCIALNNLGIGSVWGIFSRAIGSGVFSKGNERSLGRYAEKDMVLIKDYGE